jgi:hypothetical protein
MSVYFVFSDESGCYEKIRNDNFIRAHPFYCRASLIIDSDDWVSLKEKIYKLKKDYGIPLENEVKWSYLWSLKKDKMNDTLNNTKDYYFLKDFSYDHLFDYIKCCLESLIKCSYCKLIFTVTLNDTKYTSNISKPKIYRFHIQDAMQRIEMEIQNDRNLAILFLDPISNKTDKLIREAYNAIFLSGDYISEYRHIKDSLSFEISQHSFGIQLADYCVGIFNSVLKNRSNSKEIFNSILLKLLRKNPCGDSIGFGITEVPKKKSAREFIRRRVFQTSNHLDK